MANRDEKLIRELQEKLDWYTFCATDEEFDAGQVDAILKLLDKLDPVPEDAVDVDGAYSRFQEKYQTKEELEDIAFLKKLYSEDSSDDASHKNWGKAAAAVVAGTAVVMAGGISAGAIAQKPFMEVVQEGINRMKIAVTGNEMEETEVYDFSSREKRYYSSWEEVKKEHEDIKVPGYVPEGMELVELYSQDCGMFVLYMGVYEDDVGSEIWKIKIQYFNQDISQNAWENELQGEVIKQVGNVSYYRCDDNDYRAVWKEQKILYEISGDELSKLELVIENMK